MSLLQETLDKIEATAAEESSVAIACADEIHELECLVKTLNENGAGFAKPCLSIFAHCCEVSLRIVARGEDEHEAILDALHKSRMVYTTEQKINRYDGRESTIHRIIGMSAFIECFDVPNEPALAA